jgi:predicted pyridoxine 5'-phosphate oxidase superfamily flavin-nucleotide-binding protein
MPRAFAEISFTPSVLKMQEQQGSKKAYANFLDKHADAQNRLTEAETSFIGARDSFYQASVSEKSWPYAQYRGGPAGFLRVLDDRTLAYADFRGNRQYISTGNFNANNRVSIIMMDYPNRRRLKIWGRTTLVEMADDPELVASLHDESYRARPERAVTIKVEAFDWNCPQHIHPRYTALEIEPFLSELRGQIDKLTEENQQLKSKLAG